MKYILLALIFTLWVILPIFSQTPRPIKSDAINGVWLTDAKDAQVKVYRVGKYYYGKIIWLRDNKNAQGTPKLDTMNPNQGPRKRPQVGIISLTLLTYAGGNRYVNGVMYYPTNGKTYKCSAILVDNNHLKLRLYIGVTLLGKTTVFSRVS
jgi:uncharacterized protein (DUF2147 family)